jgi:hypothetical protein
MTLNNVRATRNSDTSFTVSWFFDGTATAYDVYRSDYVNGAWGSSVAIGTAVFHAGTDGGSYTDTTTVADRRYSWKISAYKNQSGLKVVQGSAQSGNYATTPAAVTSLTATRVTDGQVNLAWTNNTRIAAACVNYVDRWDNVSNAWTQVASASSSYSVTGLSADRRYQFRVRAVVSDLNTVTATTTSAYVAMTPATPTNLVATYISDTQTNLVWNNASTMGTVNTNYIERATNGGSWTQIATVAGNVSTYTATTAANNYYQYRVRAGNGLYSGYATSSIVGTTPTAPSACTATYVSDTQINVAWTAGSGTNALVERQDYLGNWTLIATLASTAVSYQDLSVVADRRYAYRVRAVNYGAYSAYSTSAIIATTPLAPSNIGTSKSGSNVTITWTNNSLTAGNVELWHAANGVWDGAALATLSPTVASYAHTGVDVNKTHQYRVRTKSSPSNTVYSAYVVSGVVTLLSAPLAPTTALNRTVFDAAVDNVTVSWVHNPTDATVQTAAEARISVLGSGTWSTASVTTQASYTFTSPVNGNTYEVQVRTKGGHADWGPWSSSKIVQASATPTVTITSPGSTITSTAKFNLAWTYYDAESTSQVAWQATLYKGAEAIESKSGTTESSYTFKAVLLNSSSYSVQLKVQDGSGLWSNVATKNVTTLFDVPPIPDVSAVFDENQGLVYINVATPAPAVGQATPDHVDIYRDGLLIAEDMSTTVSIIDYIPPLNASVNYEAVAWSTLPTATSGYAPVDTDSSEWLFINGGEGFSQAAKVKGNPAVAAALGRTKVLRTFAGRTKPVEFVGTARSRVYKLSGDVAAFSKREAELGTWAAFESLADLPAPLCYRDPLGRREFVSIGDVSVSHDAKSDLAGVECELTVIDYEE